MVAITMLHLHAVNYSRSFFNRNENKLAFLSLGPLKVKAEEIILCDVCVCVGVCVYKTVP